MPSPDAPQRPRTGHEPRERHWSEIGESTSTLGIRLLLAAFRLGGRPLFHLTLWPVALFFWAFSPRARRASRAWLAQVAACGGPRPPRLGSLAHILRFSDTILDKILAVSGALGARDLRAEGTEALLADPRGAVIVTAHTGCVELCQEISSTRREQRGLRILVHTAHAARFNALLQKLNPRFALEHIEVSSIGPQTAVELSEALARGDWVVIVADRTPIGSESTFCIPFLGRPAPFATGPFILAGLLSAPVWSMICTRETLPGSSARYCVRFEKVSEPVTGSRRERRAAVEAAARRWVQTLERALLASPLDWFNFFDFWSPAAPRGRRHEQKRSDRRS